MKKLNGWQRLWIIFSVIYGSAVVVFSIIGFPDGLNYEHQRLYDSINAVSKYDETYKLLKKAGFSEKEIEDHVSEGNKLEEHNLPGGYELETPQDIRRKYYSDLSDNEILAKLREKYQEKVNFNKIDDEYIKNMNILKKERIRYIGLAFLTWLLPLIAIYLFGLSINWVIKGFREKD